MKVLLTVAALLLVPAGSYAQGAKACDELKSEIATKLDAKGVKGYSLEVVHKDKDAAAGKIVGTCDGGTKKIVYSKTAASPDSAAKSPSNP